MSRAEEIAANLQGVLARVRKAESAAGRPTNSVTLVAVSKTMPASDVQAAIDAGQRDLGENYAQEIRDKRAAFADAPAQARPRWHFIGPLQSNKIKLVAGQVALLHSLDSADLLLGCEQKLAGSPAGANAQPVVQECLLQVNVAAEPQKRGVALAEVAALLDRFADCGHLRCIGLMVIPPLGEDPESSRPHFAALRHLRDEEARKSRRNVDLRHLSMGMSHDLEGAIAEGATLVRVGTAIFGARTKR